MDRGVHRGMAVDMGRSRSIILISATSITPAVSLSITIPMAVASITAISITIAAITIAVMTTIAPITSIAWGITSVAWGITSIAAITTITAIAAMAVVVSLSGNGQKEER